MGIVKISDLMHENLRVVSGAMTRSINAQAEHWMKIGMLSELHPYLDHHDINKLLIRAEQRGEFSLQNVAGDFPREELKTQAPAGGMKQ